MQSEERIVPGKSRTTASAGDDPYGNIRGGDSSGPMQWSQVEAGVLKRALDAVTQRGDAVVFSRTSDGGALSLRVLHDQLVTKWYPRSVDELESILQELSVV